MILNKRTVVDFEEFIMDKNEELENNAEIVKEQNHNNRVEIEEEHDESDNIIEEKEEALRSDGNRCRRIY